MAYELYEDPCEGLVEDPQCDPCLDTLELGGVRGVCYIHKNYYPSVKADPENPTVWAAGRAAGLIKVIPQTNGTSDGGAPVEVPGFGDLVSKVIGYNFQIVYKDPVLKANTPFYNSISKSSSWHFAYRTETLTRISDKPCSVIPATPVEEDKTSQVVWNVTVKFQQKEHSVMFDTPEGVFTCEPADVVPVVPVEFRYGFIADGVPIQTDIDDATVDSGTLGATLTVPADGFGNTEDAICFMAEPSTEPAKTIWYNTSINNGAIGVGETFLEPVIVGDWRVYYTAEATTFTGTVQFRIS